MRILFLAAVAPIVLAACDRAETPTTGDNAMIAGNAAMAPLDPATGNATGASSQAGNMMLTTSAFAQQAAMSDMYEIESSRIAERKATAPAVRDFAKQMIAAHTATTRDLKGAIASDKLSVTLPTALDAEHQGLIDALNAASGAEFDALYKQQQRDAHAKTLRLHQSYAATGTDAAMKSFAAATAPKVQGHIDMLARMN